MAVVSNATEDPNVVSRQDGLTAQREILDESHVSNYFAGVIMTHYGKSIEKIISLRKIEIHERVFTRWSMANACNVVRVTA